jgi:hypothetical protein
VRAEQRYTGGMPCPQYDRHIEAWTAAIKKEEALRAATMQLLRDIGRKATIETRVEARNELAAVEASLNAHIDRCEVCKAEKRVKRNSAKAQPALS